MFLTGKYFTVALAVALTGGATQPSQSSPAPGPAQAAEPAAPVPAAAPQASPAQSPSTVGAPARVELAPRAPAAATEPRPAAVNARELECMTRAILYEAGAETRAGQVAVAQVVMNRVKSRRFPNTVCGVIYQPGQFSSIRSFRHARNARWHRAEALARAVMTDDEAPVVGGALYFHATRVRPAFARSRARVATIGNHVFYR